jgi:hypothetical protein
MNAMALSLVQKLFLRAGGLAQEVECLSANHKVSSSAPGMPREKKGTVSSGSIVNFIPKIISLKLVHG